MSYLVRVELHGATGTDYTELHGYMEGFGFSREFKKQNLPTGVYYHPDGSYSAEAISGYAATAALRTNKKSIVVAAKTTDADIFQR